jgi:hypothetical protein
VTRATASSSGSAATTSTTASEGITRPPDRIRVRRNPKKGGYERATVETILDHALVAHIALVDRGEPICIPML